MATPKNPKQAPYIPPKRTGGVNPYQGSPCLMQMLMGIGMAGIAGVAAKSGLARLRRK